MKFIQRFLRLEFFPYSADLALAILRLWLGGTMLALHGWTKLSNFQKMSGKFADPFGIGSEASLALVVFAEAVGSIFLILGLFTRFAALSCMINMSVAFIFAHKMVLKGADSGELAFIYLAGYVAIFIAGPGRFALDAQSGKPHPEKKPKRENKE